MVWNVGMLEFVLKTFIIHKVKKMVRFVKFKVIANLENRTLKNLMVSEL